MENTYVLFARFETKFYSVMSRIAGEKHKVVVYDTGLDNYEFVKDADKIAEIHNRNIEYREKYGCDRYICSYSLMAISYETASAKLREILDAEVELISLNLTRNP